MRDKDAFFSDVRRVQELVYAMASLRGLQQTCVVGDLRQWRPPADMYETDTTLFIIMEVAGMRAEDFQITLKGRELVILGERCEYPIEGKTAYHNWEIDCGRFERAFCIPESIDIEGIKAIHRYEDGYLIIKLPKRKQVRDIPVE